MSELASENLEQIQIFYREAFQRYQERDSVPEIEIRFYPYVSISHTIRARGGKIYVRIAELCRTMPLLAHKALAYILVGKLLRRTVPAQAREIYSNFVKQTEIRTRAAENKKINGRKIVGSPRGEVYDLERIFADVNAVYFKNSIPKPILTWSAAKTYRVLGHHDAAHETIVISRSLDSRKVPQYVVEFVVFHEMLHIFHPTEYRNGRRYNHTPQFRRSEKKFRYYAEAENWISRNASNLKKTARQKISKTKIVKN